MPTPEPVIVATPEQVRVATPEPIKAPTPEPIVVESVEEPQSADECPKEVSDQIMNDVIKQYAGKVTNTIQFIIIPNPLGNGLARPNGDCKVEMQRVCGT